MGWLADYWWVVLLVLAGMLIGGVKALRRVDAPSYLKNRPELPPHRDNNAQWDEEDDWPKKNNLSLARRLLAETSPAARQARVYRRHARRRFLPPA